MDRLKNKIAIISGGSSGIGAATARLFHAEGANVLIYDLQPPTDELLADLMRKTSARFRYRRGDASQEADVMAAVAETVDAWGRVDTAVACAGVPGQGSDTDLTVDEWDRIMAVNARGVFLLTKHAVPEMAKVGGGAIVNISSAYGMIGAPGFAAYCASKAAVRNFTKSTALEHAAKRIRSNSIHPGVTETPMLHGIFERSEDPEATRAAFSAQQPGGFNAQPEDIAWGCVYLCSDEAKFVNGAELAIDGGIVAG